MTSPDTPSDARPAGSSAPATSRWRVGVPLVLALAGLLFAVTATTARGTNLRSAENTRLVDLIRQAEQRNERIGLTGDRLRADVDRLSTLAGDAEATQVRAQADRIAGLAGLQPATGTGLSVTLDDAPPGAIDRSYPGLPQPTPDDLVVHQQDLQAVVNAMWAGGATAVQLMDQRIISTSAVRCVGNVLLLQDRVYSPPYTVSAIGDVSRLATALTSSSAISNYLDYVQAYGLGYQVKKSARMTLAEYKGTLDLQHAVENLEQPSPTPSRRPQGG
ncbi:MAG: DUF881 domain-containing protein [Sporichthyaceae bacterium]|jgi:uncharacterized protein YlxW (UPF0749 family)